MNLLDGSEDFDPQYNYLFRLKIKSRDCPAFTAHVENLRVNYVSKGMGLILHDDSAGEIMRLLHSMCYHRESRDTFELELLNHDGEIRRRIRFEEVSLADMEEIFSYEYFDQIGGLGRLPPVNPAELTAKIEAKFWFASWSVVSERPQ